MVLSRRERYIFIGTLVAAGALVLNYLVLVPLQDAQRDLDDQRDRKSAELNKAQSIISLRKAATGRWCEMIAAGMKGRDTDAAGQAVRAIDQWARGAGVSISLLQPDPTLEKTRLPEVPIRVEGAGSMSAVAKLLFSLQTAAIPVKVTELTISARKEGADDLLVHLRVSTVCAPGQAAAAAPASAPASRAAGGRT